MANTADQLENSGHESTGSEPVHPILPGLELEPFPFGD